jgi:hypothetical protein
MVRGGGRGQAGFGFVEYPQNDHVSGGVEVHTSGIVWASGEEGVEGERSVKRHDAPLGQLLELLRRMSSHLVGQTGRCAIAELPTNRGWATSAFAGERRSCLGKVVDPPSLPPTSPGCWIPHRDAGFVEVGGVGGWS